MSYTFGSEQNFNSCRNNACKIVYNALLQAVLCTDQCLQCWQHGLVTERWQLSNCRSFGSRDVPDIQFQMAGYPAVFYYLVPVPVSFFPETGYLNRIIVVHSCGP